MAFLQGFLSINPIVPASILFCDKVWSPSTFTYIIVTKERCRLFLHKSQSEMILQSFTPQNFVYDFKTANYTFNPNAKLLLILLSLSYHVTKLSASLCPSLLISQRLMYIGMLPPRPNRFYLKLYHLSLCAIYDNAVCMTTHWCGAWKAKSEIKLWFTCKYATMSFTKESKAIQLPNTIYSQMTLEFTSVAWDELMHLTAKVWLSPCSRSNLSNQF